MKSGRNDWQNRANYLHRLPFVLWHIFLPPTYRIVPPVRKSTEQFKQPVHQFPRLLHLARNDSTADESVNRVLSLTQIALAQGSLSAFESVLKRDKRD
ncbi:hypothetical protein KPH14_005354 [Odynerus spinipes]|uniref:Uncharacterized protein n=1 Tax=Odynerus spinipes TaxID=1348599 RepID=A0AAD9VJA3_9HYME|nr:hypothetical protein KPH14_005354 [Odynerus spinipes]